MEQKLNFVMVKIHFLNVGHGDCTIIEHASGNITMIDVNNGEELDSETGAEISEALNYDPALVYNAAHMQNLSPTDLLKNLGYSRELENPVRYFKNMFLGKHIFRYIQTHPDLDHMRGIAALREEGINITNFWDTEHSKEPEEFIGDDKSHWDEYNNLRSGSGVTVLKLSRHAKNHYYNSHPVLNIDGDGIYILAPTSELTSQANESENWNNLSYVLMLVHNGIRVVFGGDAGSQVWDSIVEAANPKSELSCHILKASHHGRDSGYHEEVVKLMKPVYTIVSVGKKPEADASNKYRQHTLNEVWSTRWKGNIISTIYDNGKFDISSQYANG